MDTTSTHSSTTGMSDLINATKGQALNTGALVQANQNLVTSTDKQVTQTTNLVTQTTALVTQTTNLVTQATNQVTQLTNLVTAVTNLTTAINNSLALGPWSTWSPTIAAGTGTITTVGAVIARFAQTGKTVYFYLSIPITTNGTASNYISATLPVTPNSVFTCSGRENASSFKMLYGIIVSGSTIAILNYDSTYPGGSGFTLIVNGVYEAQ